MCYPDYPTTCRTLTCLKVVFQLVLVEPPCLFCVLCLSFYNNKCDKCLCRKERGSAAHHRGG